MNNPNQPILVVEDSPEDFEATERAFKKAELQNPLIHCEDGDDALDYLYQREDYEDAKRPLMILLDLNLPGTDGREVLDIIKADDDLKTIPVCVLTTSASEKDIKGSYKSGANSYVQKPVDFNALVDRLTRVKEYWLRTVILPWEDMG